MSEKIPCTECGAAVLPSTAERTGGLCMPCKNGNRKNIEQAKEYYKKERELDKTCPFRALWRELVDRVYKQGGGFSALSDDEKLYYSVNTLGGEVYNGGFVQYFDNTSGEHYRYAELGLVRLGATSSLKLLRQAKEELLGPCSVPQDQAERWAAIRKYSDEPDLDKLDTEFYKDPDQLDIKLENFAVEVGLVKNA
jgi:hypothetical protein